MRFLPVILIVSLFAYGCTRSDGTPTPDRAGHAWVLEGAAGGSASKELVRKDPNPGPGEARLTFQQGDRLYRIAADHGVSLSWIIERNDLVRQPRPGDKLIVPRR